MTHKQTPEEEQDLAAYLLQLEQHLRSLERFPRSSYSQVLILGISFPVLYTGFIGLISLPVPIYFVLPLVLMPGWTLFRRELKWRKESEKTREQIERVKRRQAG